MVITDKRFRNLSVVGALAAFACRCHTIPTRHRLRRLREMATCRLRAVITAMPARTVLIVRSIKLSWIKRPTNPNLLYQANDTIGRIGAEPVVTKDTVTFSQLRMNGYLDPNLPVLFRKLTFSHAQNWTKKKRSQMPRSSWISGPIRPARSSIPSWSRGNEVDGSELRQLVIAKASKCR